MSNEQYKPRGTSGRARIITDGDVRPSKQFIEDTIGHSKADIERTIVDIFCNAMRRYGATIVSATPKQQNDFDYELQVPGGTVNLELTEFIPPAPTGTNPYKAENSGSTLGEEEKRLLAAIYKKDEHYGKPSGTPVHLVVYPTDYRCRVYPEVLSLVRIALAENPPRVLENVFWVQMSNIEKQQLSVLYPFDTSIYPPEKREYVRSVKFYLFDPTDWQISYNIEGVGSSDDEDST